MRTPERQPAKARKIVVGENLLTVSGNFGRMTDSPYHVDTMSRLVRWRIDNFACNASRKSNAFKIGNWNWHLIVERPLFVERLSISLHPNSTGDDHPIGSLIIRLIYLFRGRRVLVHREIRDHRLLKSCNNFICQFDVPLTVKFIIDVEFLDLKTASPNGGGTCSIWEEGLTPKKSNAAALAYFGRMLSESIHTDIVINASDGSIAAHRAVLAARSRVFHSMFSHDMKEKEMSIINIPDMSLETCRAFLSSLYGNIGNKDFVTHRLDLLRAADKYEVLDLKEACQESLMEDIDTKNVLMRLKNANLYHLTRLKILCINYLVKFGKIYEIEEEFSIFMQSADRELVGELFKEVISFWKGF